MAKTKQHTYLWFYECSWAHAAIISGIISLSAIPRISQLFNHFHLLLLLSFVCPSNWTMAFRICLRIQFICSMLIKFNQWPNRCLAVRKCFRWVDIQYPHIFLCLSKISFSLFFSHAYHTHQKKNIFSVCFIRHRRILIYCEFVGLSKNNFLLFDNVNACVWHGQTIFILISSSGYETPVFGTKNFN